MQQREPGYKNKRLLRVAHERDTPCFLRVPFVCSAGYEPRVPCHSNFQEHGRGFSYKSHDCFAVPGCSLSCHGWLDSGPAPEEEKRELFKRALHRYMRWLIARRIEGDLVMHERLALMEGDEGLWRVLWMEGRLWTR